MKYLFDLLFALKRTTFDFLIFFWQDLTVSHIQTKKELVELDALVEESMNDYADERASVLRLNMAIVEERTCQWSLFQRSLRDLDEALVDDLSNAEFNQVKESSHTAADYIKQVKNPGPDPIKLFSASIYAKLII